MLDCMLKGQVEPNRGFWLHYKDNNSLIARLLYFRDGEDGGASSQVKFPREFIEYFHIYPCPVLITLTIKFNLCSTIPYLELELFFGITLDF